MRIVDLRSDTVTQPTPSMRRAMAEAEVGDDVFGEDPTISKLEALASVRLGKGAALFVASGTMANLVSLLTHCGRGEEVILGDASHTYIFEQGGIAALGGIHPRPLRNRADGTLDPDEITAAIRVENVHFPRTRVIALENTHNRCNGSPLELDYLREVRAIADAHSLKVHLDGARIFNASTALGVSVAEPASFADTVSFCLSKGLAAPVGSLVCGPRDFIAEARRSRKLLGGGMRQAGILAAAGIVALNEMVARLGEDHENAKRLAEGLSNIEGLLVDPKLFRTNIIYIGIDREDLSSQEVCDRLRPMGVMVLPTSPRQLRAVTHYPISRHDIEYVLDAFHRILL